MKWLALVVSLLTWPAAAQEPPEWFAPSFLDVREDVAEAAGEGKRLMLYFHQDGCPYCKQLVTVNFRDPKIVEKMRRHFMAVDIDIFGDREVTWVDGRKMSEKQFAAQMNIQFTPTLVFFDEKGAVAARINGYLPPDRFYAALDGAIGKPPPGAGPAGGKPLDVRRKAGSKPLALLLLEPACSPCDELERNLQRPEVRAQVARLELVRTPNPVDIVAAEGTKTLRSAYVPALVFFDARGREVFRTEAYLRPFHLSASLEYVASGAYSREPSFQRFLQAKAERMRSRGEPVDLWN